MKLSWSCDGADRWIVRCGQLASELSSARYDGEGTERRRRNASLRGGLVGRRDLQEHVLATGLGAEHQRERQPWRRNRGRRVGWNRHVPLAVGAQREDRIVHGRHVA